MIESKGNASYRQGVIDALNVVKTLPDLTDTDRQKIDELLSNVKRDELSEEEKKKLVQRCIEGDFDYKRIASQLEVDGSGKVKHWVKEFADEFGLDLSKIK